MEDRNTLHVIQSERKEVKKPSIRGQKKGEEELDIIYE